MKTQATILIIDDEVDLVEMLQFQLSAHGYNVITAHDGLEGLEKLKFFIPDLIILDLNMPKMGGIEFYQEICDAQSKPKYPILILTARSNTKQLFKDFEVEGYMTKPVDMKQLLAEIARILKRRSRQYESMLGVKDLKTVFIVENDEKDRENIDKIFNDSGYNVVYEQSGKEAIEKMTKDPPDLALIKLGLTDISGDLIALRLKSNPETKAIRSLVYVSRSGDHHRAVIETIGYKTGIVKFVQYTDPNDLLTVVDRVFHK